MNPDIDSFKEINYINDTRQILLFSDLTQGKKVCHHSPRALLKNSLNDLAKAGLKVESQCSINFMIFNEKYKKNQDSLNEVDPITPHANNMNFLHQQVHDELLNKFQKALRFCGIKVESVVGEDAPGQFRLNLALSDDIVEFCDNLLVLKLVIFTSIILH